MIKIIDHIADVYDLTFLEELSIEINPDPVEDMLDMIQTISKTYKHFPRVRFSVGIQSFDNEVLEESGRAYNFASCVDFLRRLVPIKMDHNVFNFDFIAFGKFNTTRKWDIQLRDPAKIEFFQNFAESDFADSFSLYTLELFEGSDRYNKQSHLYSAEQEGFWLKKYGSDDDVYAEFELLKEILLEAGYKRYEISNYSKAGKNSIHNRIYRSMGERLWLGTSATSHITNPSTIGVIQDLLAWKNDIFSLHFSITPSLKQFIAGDYINSQKTEFLTEYDYYKEKFMMGMRTMEWVTIGQEHEIFWSEILVENREEKANFYQEQWLCIWEHNKLKLTDRGMDVYNSIITELMN